MKVLRPINSVKVCDAIGDEPFHKEHNKEMTLSEFDSGPAYYNSVIKPMLMAGHEGELINWLKNVGLLANTQRCRDEECQGVMNWVPFNSVDLYKWQCKLCKKKQTIRKNSVFQDFRCRFDEALRIMAGWCRGLDAESMANLLNLKKHAISNVYNIVAETASRFMRSNISYWKLGGPNTVVLVDVFPEGLSKLDSQENMIPHNDAPILCLAEAKDIPTKYWFETLDRYNTCEQLKVVNAAALRAIETMVQPGSILVTNLDTDIASYATLKFLSHLYPVIVSIEGLKRHDVANELLNNLETIWHAGIDICFEAHCHLPKLRQQYLVGELWRRRFGHEAFEKLLNQMCYSSA